MKEHRSWEQMKSDNDGAAWIIDGEFCPNYKRSLGSKEANDILESERMEGVEEWQLAGFNGCWSCDKILNCQFYIAKQT